MGRIRVDSIVAPHTAASITQCIAKFEKNVLLASGKLFMDITGALPVAGGETYVLSGDGNGSTPDEPVALVVQAEDPGPRMKYTRRIQANSAHSNMNLNSR